MVLLRMLRELSVLHEGPRRHLRHHQRRFGFLLLLVSKLRENAKTVIGVGVKNSTSDLFLNNCDEFIYYDDLVRKEPSKRRRAATAAARTTAAPAENRGPEPTEALDLVVETLEAVTEERGENEPIWGLDDQTSHQAPASGLQ